MALRLFRRAWKVTLGVPGGAATAATIAGGVSAGAATSASTGALDVSEVDLEFKILRSIKSVPNKCVLTLWNLNSDHQAQLLKRNHPTANKLVGIPVQVEAGYVQETSVLFSGDLREVVSMREGSNWKTVLSGEDAGRSYREARMNVTFEAGTPIGTVFSACAQAMGIGTGNASDFSAGAEIAGIGSVLSHPMTFSGSAKDALNRITKSVGLTWSAQKGVLQIQKKGQPLALGAIRLSPDTGLLDSPEAAIDASVTLPTPKVEINASGVVQGTASIKPTQKPTRRADPNILKVRAMLIPGLVPGRQIILESARFNGAYMITECEYVGQTWSNNWQVDMVVRRFG